MFEYFVYFFALFTFVQGQINSTNVQKCTSNPGDLPLNTEVVGCLEPPCQLPQLQDAIINVIFKSDHNIKSMRTLVTAYMPIGPIVLPVPYDLADHSYTCNFLENTYCPIQKGDVIQYKLAMYIEPFFPVGTAVSIEFRIVDEKDSSAMVCIRLPVQIIPPVDQASKYQERNDRHNIFNLFGLGK